MMVIRFYLLVSAYAQEEQHVGVHEAFEHGGEPLENHENLQLQPHDHTLHPEHAEVYEYEIGDMHSDVHDLAHGLHDGSDFVIEDHIEHPAWNFMEDGTNKAVEENMVAGYPHNPNGNSNSGNGDPPALPATSAATSSSTAARTSPMAMGAMNFQPARMRFNPPQMPVSRRTVTRMQQPRVQQPSSTIFFNSAQRQGQTSFQSPIQQPIVQPQPRQVESRVGCTNDPTKATMMAQQLIGMLTQSSVMMSKIVIMLNLSSSGSTPTAPVTPTPVPQPRPMFINSSPITTRTRPFTVQSPPIFTSAANTLNTPTTSQGNTSDSTYNYNR